MILSKLRITTEKEWIQTFYLAIRDMSNAVPMLSMIL